MPVPSRPIVAIGAVAAGTSAASQAKRRSGERDVIMIEKGPHVSYGGCGLPYNILDPRRDIEDLVVISAAEFRSKRGIDTRVRSEALAIDPEKHAVRVRDHVERREYTIEYDRLIVATGAAAAAPDLPGMDLDGVFRLRTLEDGAALKKHLVEKKPRRAAVIGMGTIALEMAEVFKAYGCEVTGMDVMPHVPAGYEPEICARVRAELEAQSVETLAGVSIQRLRGDGRVTAVETDRGDVPADVVLVAAGVVPATGIAARAGIALGVKGAIRVNALLETSVPEIYAAGDCAEHWHVVLEKPAYVPLGTTANKQGRIAGANAVGRGREFRGIAGTAVFRVLGLEVARTGLGLVEAAAAGFDARKTVITHRSRAHAYPGSGTIIVVMIHEKSTGRLLGGQMAGEEGVSKRIDILAACLHHRSTIAQVAELDLAYAPPFSPVWDPILVCAGQAKKG
jgi:NADPH-dependent 2,4-dienoyl-CoA reductase/sulfur reductase-like enzyme